MSNTLEDHHDEILQALINDNIIYHLEIPRRKIKNIKGGYRYQIPETTDLPDIIDNGRESVIKAIHEAGGIVPYFEKFYNDIPFNKLADPLKLIYNHIQMRDDRSINILKKLDWKTGEDEFKRQFELLKKDEIHFDNIEKIISCDEMPYFKRHEEPRAAVSLFIYWHEQGHIGNPFKDDGSFIYEKITGIFKMNSFNNWNTRGLETAVRKIIKQNQRKKVEVFEDLLGIK